MNFRSSLRSFLLRWRLGLLLAGVLRAACLAGGVLLALGVFDFYAGLSDPARRIAFAVFAAAAGTGAVLALWDAITFMRRDAARAADSVISSGRRDVLSALELTSAASAGDTSLARWLRERSVESAAARVASLPFSRALPLRTIRRRSLHALAVALMFAALALAVPAAFQTIARRLLDPAADVPPYSPLHFTLGPASAEVLYGGELVVTADISGGKPETQVRCITRDPATGKTEESPAFQENPARFARKLEKVTAPLEVAFTVGRARSAWMPVVVRTQPKIQEVILTVEPPVYSGMPSRQFAAGTQELAALPGSRITARVTSNRPLSGGTLSIFPPGSEQAAQQVAGEREGTHRIKFTWAARNAARLSFDARDVVGTASEPLQVEQKLLPDERPEVALHEPAGEILATPETELPLEASARDDFGLTRVALVRRLVGYRERSLAEAIQSGERKHQINGRVSLASYGVLPGQTIELMLEARDTNPNLLGVSISEPARIHIITREEYARMLRDRTTLEEFAGRYAALAEAMEKARKSLEDLDAAAKSGNAAKAEEARRKAFEAHQEAAQTFTKLARDFPIFDLDPALAQASADVAKNLAANGRDLDDLANASAGQMADAVPTLKKRLGETEKRVEQELKKGERAVAAARVIEQAGKFKQLIEEQRELVKDLNRLTEQVRRGETQAGPALRDIAKRQHEIAGTLRDVDRQLDEALQALPDEFARVKEEGLEFLKMLRERSVPPLMDEAAKSADTADSRSTQEKSSEALARLEDLLKRKNGICNACRGEGEEPFPWPEDLAQTMQQLMQSLIPRPGAKPGSGAGGEGGSGQGGSGDSENGYSMRGNSPRLPMYGPPRSSFSRNAGPQLGGSGKNGSGSGKGAPEGSAEVPRDEVTTKPAQKGAGEGAAAEAVPEAYRAAVKRFFSTEPVTQQPKP